MKKCKNCYYYDKCDGTTVCADYTPLEDELCDRALDTLIEERRRVFFDEYAVYASQYDDDLFFW